MMPGANDVVAIVRDMSSKDPVFGQAIAEAYGRVCDRIEARALAKVPKPRVFEVRHELQEARFALLSTAAEGKGVALAEAAALDAIGLQP